MKLKNLLKDLELGKVYTDKDRKPFKVNEDHHDKKEGKMAKYDAKEIADDAMDVFNMIDKIYQKKNKSTSRNKVINKSLIQKNPL